MRGGASDSLEGRASTHQPAAAGSSSGIALRRANELLQASRGLRWGKRKQVSQGAWPAHRYWAPTAMQTHLHVGCRTMWQKRPMGQRLPPQDDTLAAGHP